MSLSNDHGTDGTVVSSIIAREIDELLFALTRHLIAYREAQFCGLDLTYPQAQVLQCLTRPLPMSELADRLHCTGSNITGIVDRLEARGLLERSTPASDRRVKRLALTREGIALKDRVDSLVSATPLPFTSSPGELVLLRDMLHRYLDHLVAATPDCTEAVRQEVGDD